MKILFTFENPLPSRQADAEVFITTARHLAPLISAAWLHVPTSRVARTEAPDGLTTVPAWAPLRPAALRHLFCGLTLVLRREFRQADLVYTRNLWIAWVAILFGQRVVFDHYRPWPDQIPPLQYWLYRLNCSRRFLLNICHSDYTRGKYLKLGVAPGRLVCVRNGFEPRRLRAPLPLDVAKREIGVEPGRSTVVYTGRLNHRKGLALVMDVAARLPEILFILVGSSGDGPIERLAAALPNIRIVAWQPPDRLGRYVFAADILLIPPSWKPLAEFGSTVLPLKLFLYMASGRPIVAGATPDVLELLGHDRNALLCRPDDVDALAAAIRGLLADPALGARLAAAARADGATYTWDVRAHRIAGLIAERLHARSPAAGGWGRAQSRIWRRQSWRWLLHLLRARSWVLPPDFAALDVARPAEAAT